MRNVKIPVDLSRIQQIRIQWDNSSKRWHLLIIWDKEIENRVTGENVMAIDLEEINKANYDKSRRIERGLFRTNSGMLINADVNGALNILRRYTKCISKAVQAVRDNGRLDSPLRIRIA